MNRAERRRREKELKKAARKAGRPGSAGGSAGAERWFDEGNLLVGQKRFDEAEQAYRQALALNPEFPEALGNLASLLDRLGRLPEAEDAYRKALVHMPDHPVILTNLGSVLEKSEKTADALDIYRRAADADPGSAERLYDLGRLLGATGALEDALAALGRAIDLAPDLAKAQCEIGNVLLAQEKPEAALQAFERTLEIDPAFAAAHSNMGLLLCDALRYDEAIAAHDKALAIAPEDPTALRNAGLAYLLAADDPARAVALYRKALALTPGDTILRLMLATALLECDDPEAALAQYDAVLELRPGDPEILSYRFAPLLIMQHFDDGHAAHEFMPQLNARPRPFEHDVWRGEDLAGKSIVVWAQEGVGDVILNASCLPDIEAAAARCVVEVEDRLVPLFARSFPKLEVVSVSNPPNAAASDKTHDFQTSLSALPRHLRRSLEAFPRDGGYLRADGAERAGWRDRLAGLGDGLKVGIAWRSGLISAERQRFYTDIAAWSPILSLPELRFVNLQYGDGEADLGRIDENLSSRVTTFDDLDLMNDLDGSAALISELDLVISPLIATSWLAGAVGTPTWVLQRPGDWRMFGTDYFPWQPSVRMFVKPVGKTWNGMLGMVAVEIAERAEG